ncbi:hypothetical protein DVA81_19135, partial [Acinetobacter baumannii]
VCERQIMTVCQVQSRACPKWSCCYWVRNEGGRAPQETASWEEQPFPGGRLAAPKRTAPSLEYK